MSDTLLMDWVCTVTHMTFVKQMIFLLVLIAEMKWNFSFWCFCSLVLHVKTTLKELNISLAGINGLKSREEPWNNLITMAITAVFTNCLWYSDSRFMTLFASGYEINLFVFTFSTFNKTSGYQNKIPGTDNGTDNSTDTENGNSNGSNNIHLYHLWPSHWYVTINPNPKSVCSFIVKTARTEQL